MNKWKKSWIAIFMVLMLMLSGCGADVQGESQPSKDQTGTTAGNRGTGRLGNYR